MILEEVVAFSEEVDAVEFISFLKSKGCRARREVRGIANADEVVEGALDDLIAWFEEAAAQSEEEEPPELSDDARWFRDAAEKYRRQRDQIAALLEGHKPGDILYTNDDLKRSREELFRKAAEKIQAWIDENEDKDLDEELDDSTLFEILFDDRDPLPADAPLFVLHAVLMSNNILEETPEGYRLTGERPAGKIVMEISTDDLPDLDTDLLEDAGLMIKAAYWIDPLYQVVIDPAIHFVCEPDEVLTALEGTTVDIESATALEDNLRVKGFIIATLLEEVKRKPGISVDDLSGLLRVETADEDGELMTYEIAIDRRMASSIVAELRKVGILTGSDQKIKIGGTPGGRKRQKQ
jgi:hypothetical protein